jgi:hypothetical protein
LLLAALLPALSAPPVYASMAKAKVTAAGQVFSVDVATEAHDQARGLGGRKHLGPGDGMVFVYPEKSRYTFWMKDMLIPIDILWLDNLRIVHIAHRVPFPKPGTAESALPTYAPEEPANIVLEIAAGRAKELGLREGDQVAIDFSATGR